MALNTMTHWRTIDEVEVSATPSDAPTSDEFDDDGSEPAEVVAPPEPEAVDPAEAEKAWIDQVHLTLTEVAGSYHKLITHTDLAVALQDATGLRTRTSPNAWMDRVLAAAAALDLAAGRPPLTSLVVHKTQGTVGAHYSEVLRLTGQDPIDDEVRREKHAAAARMDCYRWADAKMPSDGGNPALSPRFDMVVSRERRKAREEAKPDVCPNCFMAIPPTGICDACA
jgi:hypothetical protein